MSGQAILSFLNRNGFRSKPTELAFQQEGHGPIVLKNLSEIWINDSTEIFSSCNLKFKATTHGV